MRPEGSPLDKKTTTVLSKPHTPNHLPTGANLLYHLDGSFMNGNAASVRAIAFFLPQFHPIPENDAWWGKGFTEWTNVAKAKPSFKGHYQPQLPADLGFYDLRVPEVREAQATLAREHGIHGFCYYHYWFSGRRLLERPVNDLLASGKPDFPFCLCWANEPWSRRWDGSEKEILMPQDYSEEDDRHHLRWLAGAFRDSRYIRVHGKPLFLVYRASGLPDARGTAEAWRDEARKQGLGDLYLCNVENFKNDHGITQSIGFDAAVEFAPDMLLSRRLGRTRLSRYARRLGLANEAYFNNHVSNYSELIEKMLAKPAPDYLRFPGVTPGFDNTARHSKKAMILIGSTPALYGSWLRETVKRLERSIPEERIVFLNAWNEWAEGNHLEPCQKWGRRYLEETACALAGQDRKQ